MLPSLAPSRPRTRRVRYPRASSRRVKVMAWIDGPPTLSRAMMRTRLTVSASGGIAAVDTSPHRYSPDGQWSRGAHHGADARVGRLRAVAAAGRGERAGAGRGVADRHRRQRL